MRQNNTGMKVVLVILVIVCLFQGASLSSMQEELDYMNNEMQNLTSTLRDLRYELSELQNQDAVMMDVSYGIDEVDWQEGTLTVSFIADVPSAVADSRVVINNGIEKIELTKNGNVFSGTMKYPISDEDYATDAYLYEGSLEMAGYFVDNIGIANIMGKFLACEFYGYSSYGNDKLTLAGTLAYQVNLEDKVTSMKLVYNGEEQALDIRSVGEKEINVSIPVTEHNTGEYALVKALYIEAVTDSGIIYRVYPELGTNNNYQISVDGAVEMLYPDQYYWVEVILSDGTIYEFEVYNY